MTAGPTCGAKNRAGSPCGLPAGWGTKHPGDGRCRLHGGASPQAEAGAEQRRLKVEAHAAVSRHALPRDVDPATALLEEVCRAAGAVEWIRARIEELEPGAIVWGPKSLQRQVGQGPEGPVDITTAQEAAGVHIWWRLYGEERDRLARVSKDALAAGVSERQLRLQEQLAVMLANGMKGLLNDLGLSTEQREAADQLAMKQFERLVQELPT